MTYYLPTQAVIEINAQFCTAPVKDPNGLESAVHLPQQVLFGQEAYPHLLTKAACLLRGIAANHAFHDGNKRTAWTSTMVFLAMNGVELEADDLEAADFVVNCVSDHWSLEDIAAWIADHML